MADSTYNTLLKIAFEVDNATDIEGARAAVGRLVDEAKKADEAGAAFTALGVDITKLRTGMSQSEQLIVNSLRTIASSADTTGDELRTSLVAALDQVKSPAALKQIEQDLKELAIQGRNVAGPMQMLGGVTMDLRKEADAAAGGARRLGQGMQEAGGMAGPLKEAIAGLGLGYLAKSAMDAVDGLKRLENGFTAVFGSAEATKRELDFVRGIASTLGIDLSATANAYLSLAAAAQGTNLEGARTRDVFAAVSTAMATLGKGTFETEGALQALGQMISKGTVQAEELKGQLGERLPGAFQLAARAMGVTTAELQKQLEAGTVLAEDLLPRLAEELNKTYGEGAKKVETFGAAFTRMWTDIKTATATAGGGGVQSFFTSLIEGAGKTVLALSAVPMAVSETVRATAEVTAAATAGGSVLGALREAADRAGQGFWDLGLQILNVRDPVAVAAEDIARLSAATEAARTPLERLQAAAKGDLQALPSDLKAIVESLRASGDAATAAEAAFAKFAAAPDQLAVPDKVLQFAETIELIGANSEGAGAAVREKLGKALEELTTTQLANLGAEAQKALGEIANNEDARQAVMGLGDIVDSVAAEAMRRLGIDGQEALTGIDAKTREAMASLDILGQMAGVSAQTIRQAFTDLIGAANTQQELDALSERLRQMGADGKLAAEDITAGMAQIESRAAAVQEQLDPVQQALNRIGVDGREAVTGIDAQFQGLLSTLQGLTQNAAVAGEALAQAVNKGIDAANTRIEFEELSSAVRAMGEQGKLSGEQVKSMLAEIAVEAGKITDATDATSQALRVLGVTGSKELQAIADHAVIAFNTLKNSGEASTGDLNAAFEAMAERVLQAAQALGPLAAATEAWKLRAMAATEEQREALEQLIEKYAESGAAAEQAAQTQVAAANTAAEAIENYASRVEARAGAGALAFQSTAEALDGLGGSQRRVIDGYDALSQAGKTWAEQQLREAQLADARTAGTMLFRDEVGKTIREIENLIETERQQVGRVEALKKAYEAGIISTQALQFQLSQLALVLRDPLTNAGSSAKKTIQDLLAELLNLMNSANEARNSVASSFARIGAVNFKDLHSQINSVSYNLEQVERNAKSAYSAINKLNSISLK